MAALRYDRRRFCDKAAQGWWRRGNDVTIYTQEESDMKRLIATTMLMLVAGGAEARSPKNAESQDPNKVICRTEEVLGSRLASKKICLTAQQWRDRAFEARQVTDRVQANRQSGG